jgi:mevalonate pyrophosphate decarboxylase
MKLQFEDKSFIECRKSDTPDKIVLIISAKDNDNSRKKITNACEITKEEFQKLISDIQ